MCLMSQHLGWAWERAHTHARTHPTASIWT